MRRLFCVFSVLGGAFAVAAGCASNENGDVRTTACSDGPAYDAGADFPDEVVSSSASPCVPHCGAERVPGESIYRVSALPSGACANLGESCDMAARMSCPCASRVGPYNGYRCTCVGGTWSCKVTSRAARSCGEGCDSEDAGLFDSGIVTPP